MLYYVVVVVSAVTFIIGLLIGCYVKSWKTKKKSIGILKVDMSKPDNPFLFLELSEDIPYVCEQDAVYLEVRVKKS